MYRECARYIIGTRTACSVMKEDFSNSVKFVLRIVATASTKVAGVTWAAVSNKYTVYYIL